MKKTIVRIAVCSLLVTAVAVGPTQVRGQEAKKDQPAAEKKSPAAGEKKASHVPFHGKVDAVDKTAMTVTVGERLFQITSETRINKAGKPATLDDAAVGEEIRGSYEKAADGKLLAKTVNLGSKPEGEAKKSSGAKAKKAN